MFNKLLKLFFLTLLCMTIFACANLKMKSELEHGERLFKAASYQQAMQQLLPLAVDGNPKAQYAVGYMYYYGYGVARDTNAGLFWINRAADQHYQPAIEALAVIKKNEQILKKQTGSPRPAAHISAQ